MCTFEVEEIEITLSGLDMVVRSIEVELDTDGSILEIRAPSGKSLTSKPDAAPKALHAAICEALRDGYWRSVCEEHFAAWLADAGNREADHRYERSY